MTDGTDTEIWVEEFLTRLLELAGLDVYIEEISIDEEENLTVQLSGEDSARAIGRDGQVLDAIQQMVVSAAVHGQVTRRRIIVDIEKYRDRREKKICEDAKYFAGEVLASGKPYEFPPMSPRERRLVHMSIVDMGGVTTESRGEDDERYVRIIKKR
jgi:spoIIIJ-associated protein